ncbi:MAG: hypothetical protein LBQ46_11885 [Treponema sp.]|jgi:putative aldouronate transport system substrate-binding protein|nr:hypothetical protein [Treponema sp.]
MKRNSKKAAVFPSLFFVLIIAALVTACGGRKEDSSGSTAASAALVTAPGQLPIVIEPLTLSIGLQQSQNVADHKTNYLTGYLREKTGIDFDFYFFSSNIRDATTQLELMISSNEKLPDILAMVGLPNWQEHGDAGVFVDLNPLYEQYAYFYNERISGMDPAEKDRIRIKTSSSSGKRYAYPMYSYQVTQNYRSMNFINQTWLNNLGLPMPSTTEEFYTTLVAFRDRDPNKNGKKDEIPFLGSLSAYASEPLAFLINAFVYYPYRDAGNWFLNVTDGKLWTPWTTEEYREALRYINRLYREGLIAPATFTITQQEMVPLLSYAQGETPTVGFFSGHQNQVLRPETPAIFDYTYQVSLTGPKGVNWYPKLLPGISPSGFITKDNKYPEVSFRFLDFLSDLEATMTARYGELGVDWRYVDPSENARSYLDKPAWFQQINMIWGVPQNKHWFLGFAQIFIPENDIANAYWVDDGSWNASRYKMYQKIFINDGKDAAETLDTIVYTKEEEDEIREMRATIDAYRQECLSLFSTGAMNLDRDWNTYLSELDKMGLKKYLETAQKAYTRTIGR